MSLKLGNTNIAGTQVLYSTTGNNTDGAMTQAATTTELNNKADIIVVNGKANDIDVVHLTGNETIADTKTFTSPINVPQSASWFDMIKMEGSNRPYIAGRSNASVTALALCTLRNNQYYNIEIINNGDGTGYTVCPASDVNGSIVTTVNKSKNSTGYLQLGNGIILNWGYAKMTNDNTTVMTFAKAFSGANNYGMAQGYWSPASGRQDPLTITAKTNTGFTIRNSAGSGTNYCFWVAIGY